MSAAPPEVVYGRHACEALLRHRPASVQQLWLGDSRAATSVAQQAQGAKIGVRRVARAALDELCEGGAHQGVAALVAPFAYAQWADLLPTGGAPALLLVLDHVQDPRNVGALIRSAVAFGATGVLVPKDRTAPMSGVAIKASAGAAFAVPIVRVANLRRALQMLKEAGVWVYGLAADGQSAVRTIDWRGPAAIVVGAEGSGLRPLTRQTCDAIAELPAGGMESLNAATAGAIAMYEAACQRLAGAAEPVAARR